MNKTLLITGANGIFARKIIEKLVNGNNYNIIASTRNIANLSYKISGITYVNNSDLISTEILKDVDLIINCAFPRTEDITQLYEAMQFFECLVLKSIDTNVKSFINISSQSVYGSYRETLSYEMNDLKPENNYAITKIACESIGWALTKDTNTKFTNIRLASLIGVEYDQRAINKIIVNAKSTHCININNDKNVLGYLDINDAVDGLCEFVKNSQPNNWKAIYNLGQNYENSASLKEISLIIKELFSNINIDIKLNIENTQKADIYCLMDSSWFYKDAMWTPKIPINKTIQRIFISLM